MRDDPDLGNLPSPVPRALIDAELAALAASAGFRRSPRHVRFLRHLVQATLDGQHHRLREMALGVEVFLRNATRFDPRSDTIVRVEARRLRQKLAAYYADEGLDARLQFVLPVGRYAVQVQRRSPRDPALRNRNSVAVHDFSLAAGGDLVDLQADTALAGALSAELAAAVQRLNGLRVVAAGAAPPGGPGAALGRAAQRLKVDSVVLGQLVRAGTELVLQLRLLRVEDGHVMWSRQAVLEREHPLLALEALARGIVSTLQRDAAERQLQRIHLSGSTPYLHSLAGGGPTARGMELLALARVAMRRNGADDYRKAVQLAEEAVVAMPGYAGAFALLAEALIGSVASTTVPARPMLDSARRAAERAIELDPELAESLGQLGQLLFIDARDWPAAEARLLEALRLAPASASAHARYAFLSMMGRRFADAHAAYAEARDLDPLSLLYRCHAALVHLYAGDHDAAASGLDAVLEVDCGHLVALALRAALDLYRGNSPAALKAYAHLDRQHPKLSIGLCGLAQAQAMNGDGPAARAGLARLLRDFDNGYVSPYQIAMVQARLGDVPATLRWLDSAARMTDYNFVCAGVDPCFDTLRRDPAFGALLRRHGLASVADPVVPDP